MDPQPFAELLIAHQSRLHAFVFAQVLDPNRAVDVLQETNRALLESAPAFRSGRDFLPWAFTYARNQVRAERARRGRDRWVLEEDVEQTVAEHMGRRVGELSRPQVALAECLERLGGPDRELLDRRYGDGQSIEDLSRTSGKSSSSISTHLHRLRAVLAECIRGRMTAVGGRG